MANDKWNVGYFVEHLRNDDGIVAGVCKNSGIVHGGESANLLMCVDLTHAFRVLQIYLAKPMFPVGQLEMQQRAAVFGHRWRAAER